MLVIPDVHGRTFWREPIEKYPEEEVIFLGDYVDPYLEEGITKEEAVYVLQEIISLKKRFPDRITLLLGNHDLMYLHPLHRENSCRHDYQREMEIEHLYSPEELFSLATIRENFVFSHAGIHPGWLKRFPEFGGDIISSVEYLNKHLWEKPVMEALAVFSNYRGGWECRYGSPVWSDVREWVGEKLDLPEGITQVFGHTQLIPGKIIEGPGYADIDCKHVIRIVDNKLEVL